MLNLGDPSPILAGWLGSLVAGLATGVGALPVLVRPRWRLESLALMLALAAGVMLGATFFSLLLPALEIAERQTGGALSATAVTSAGFGLGALAIAWLHQILPHTHFVKGREGTHGTRITGHWLFVLAIALHNVPEGLSVGVAYGDQPSTGLAVTLGIGLQNMPEGLAVATALTAVGLSRARAFGLALLTGLVEPVGGLVGAVVASVSAAVLPWALSFAAGAMLFVISGEVIPETHRPGTEKGATFSLVGGFLLMMWLDAAFG